MKIQELKKEVKIFKVGNEEFLTESEAKIYQAQVHKLEKIRYYSISHGFDATEGRGYFKRTLVQVLPSQYINPKEEVIYYCENVLGKKMRDWYNDSIYCAWSIHEFESKEEYELASDRSREMDSRVRYNEIVLSQEKLDIFKGKKVISRINIKKGESNE